MSHAILVHETGGPEVLIWQEIDVPVPGPGEVLLRHSTVGFNMIDTYRRKGLYPCDLPFIPGSEAAGVVEETGEGVDTLKAGDRVVYAIAGIGAYAEKRVIGAEHLVRIPDDISDDTAAAAFLKGLTTWYLIHRTWELRPGDTALVYAAAGGVGTILCQWASHLSARIIGVVGSDEKIAVARENGCDEVINYSKENIAERVKAITGGRGVDVVYDSIGKATFNDSLDSLRPRGLMVSYGNATGPVPPVNVLDLMRKGSLFLTRPTLFNYTQEREELEAAALSLFDVLQSGAVNVRINQEFRLEEAPEAHALVESRKTTGATILHC